MQIKFSQQSRKPKLVLSPNLYSTSQKVNRISGMLRWLERWLNWSGNNKIAWSCISLWVKKFFLAKPFGGKLVQVRGMGDKRLELAKN